MAVFPVCRSPKINSRWPRPMGMSASMTVRPVWRGTDDGRPVHDGRSGTFDGQPLGRGHGPLVIERPPERVDDASHEIIAHGNVHDSPRPLDFIAFRVQVKRVVAQQYDAEFVIVHVERDAEYMARETLRVPRIPRWEARTPCSDTCGDTDDRANLSRYQLA